MATPTLQKPIGQNKDGSLIYEQNMSVMPEKKPFTPVSLPTPLPMTKVSGVNIAPAVNPEIAQRVNAPVNDTL